VGEAYEIFDDEGAITLDSFQLQQCDIQGRLFEISEANGYGSEDFCKAFMLSAVAKALDSQYNRMQWAGEEYLMEEICSQCPEISKAGTVYSRDVLYWMGYVYRYWHFLTGETSKAIYKQAPARTMNINYLMFHTMDPEMAIEDLKTIYQQRRRPRKA
jgi:hypothetical protein